jgi:ubiquinone/menaquinone biosynthesis C-methylase UbiE
MPKADYGIDAPVVIRNQIIAAAIGIALWLSAVLHFWSGEFSVLLGKVQLHLPLAQMGLVTAILCLTIAALMLWSSKIGKVKRRERLLDQIEWTGRERVLDVGCGRGLMLIGAAKRLTTGLATGIDIWQAEDLSGNHPEAARTNAALEGVIDRVEVKTADMREIPFPDAFFDVAVSCVAIHNLYKREDRDKAIREIARVLKAGGKALIDDIRHTHEYLQTFSEAGCHLVRRSGSRIAAGLITIITWGSLRPATILVEKD